MADGLLNKASIILTPTGYKAGTLYNVAPVVEPYEDFDFARASVASRVNSSGLVEMVGRTLGSELVTNGDFATDSDWNKGNKWSISGGSANKLPNATSNISQVIDGISGKLLQVVFTVSNYRGNGGVGASADGSNYTQNEGNGTFTEYITPNSNNLYIRGSYSFEASIDNVSVKEVIDTNNIPRINYDSNGENGHILLEPTTTNLYLNTDTLSTQNVSTSASDYSVSFYGTGTITFSGSYSGSLVGTGVNDRVSLTFTATSGTLTSTVSGSVTNAQIENLGYSTSYMPSYSTQGVRATETATGAGSADLINSTEGVLYAEIAALDDGISQQIGVYGNSTTKQLRIEISNSVIRAQLFNGAYQANMSSTQTVTNFNKIAFKWKVNDFALWINGAEVATDSSGSTFPANDLDRLNLSGQNGISSLAQAKIKSLAVFNEALSDSELTQLTT